MKKLLILAFTILLFVGCSSKDGLNIEDLKEKHQNGQKTYTSAVGSKLDLDELFKLPKDEQVKRLDKFERQNVIDFGTALGMEVDIKDSDTTEEIQEKINNAYGEKLIRNIQR